MDANCHAGAWRSTGRCAYRPLVVMAISVAILGIAHPALAHRSPSTCTNNGSSAAIGFVAAEGATTTRHGDEICFQVLIFNTCGGCCDIADLDAELMLPTGAIVPIAVDASVLAGDQMFCPGDPRCATPSNCTIPGPTACDGGPCVGYRYIVNHADEHAETGTNCPPTPQSGIGEVSAFLRSTGGTVHMQTHVGANICKAIAADIPHACCEPCTGTCTDVDSPSECPFPNVFSQDKNCDEITCAPLDCTPFVTLCSDSQCNPSTGVCDVTGEQCGACCNHEEPGGVCTPNVPPSECTGGPLEFFLNETCEAVEARGDCDGNTGACCDQETFGGCTVVPASLCNCTKCVFHPETSCEEVECTHNSIPTVSQWGLVVMTLLLLTGAKIFFGRRRAGLA